MVWGAGLIIGHRNICLDTVSAASYYENADPKEDNCVYVPDYADYVSMQRALAPEANQKSP